MKKILTIILLGTLILDPLSVMAGRSVLAMGSVAAKESTPSGESVEAAKTETTKTSEILALIQAPQKNRIKKEIKDAIIKIYGKENSEEIYQNVMDIAQKAIAQRSAELENS